MGRTLLSVGLDVGTTSTQMILSELVIENRAGSFSVPEMDIARRRILYKSPVGFTPLLDESRVDAGALKEMVAAFYADAGIRREDVDTGAIIITGETSRKENARAVLAQLSGFAGDFVVATAGPDLESMLAAKGAGADRYARRTGKTVLHMDIGGGTSNLALIRDGEILGTGCLNVGGRLLKFDEEGRVRYVSPVLRGLWDAQPGQQVTELQVAELANKLVQVLEMAAGLRERTPLLEKMMTTGTSLPDVGEDTPVISFSGGVADCILRDVPWLSYGDMGPILGRVIRGSRLCAGAYVLGEEPIRATVIGAGCHSAQLSGSTVYHKNVAFPLKNLPVVALNGAQQDREDLAAVLDRELNCREGGAAIALPGFAAPCYGQVARLAEKLAKVRVQGPLILCLEQDMAKALGQALAVRLPPDAAVLCIDRVRLTGGSYLDVAAPVGPALPVVVKTLVLHGQ